MPERVRADDAIAAAPQQRSRPNDNGGNGLLRLQRHAGNHAVSRLVAAAALQREAGEEAATSGTLPDLDPDELPAYEKGAGELKEDGPDGAAAGARGAHADDRGRGALLLDPTDVRVSVSTPELDQPSGRSRADSVSVGAVTNTFANPDTSPSPKAFGSESFKPGYKDVAFTVTPGSVSVAFALDIQCPWGTNAGGRTDVPSATAGVVTADNYSDIVADLTPSLDEKSWRAPRSKYWSEAICKRHERFHSTDDQAWSEGAGKQVVTDYLKTKTVNAATAKADLETHLTAATKAMGTANFQYYTGGAASYLSYKGEERAFGDGKQPYIDLATGVAAQGQKLKAAATPAPK